MTITRNRIQFPEAPTYVRDYVDLPNSSEPRVDNRWHVLRTAAVTANLFWRGSCTYCGNGIWDTLDTTDDDFNIADYVTSSMLATEFENWDGVSEESREALAGDKVAICQMCHANAGRRQVAADRAVESKKNGDRFTLVEWPKEIVGELQQRIIDERAKMAHLSEPYPVIPRQGAYMWVPEGESKSAGALKQFDSFTDDRKVRMKDGTEYEQDAVLAMTSAVYGVRFKNGIILPSSGYPAEPADLTKWMRGMCRTKRVRDGYIRDISASHVAVMVPVLDPDAESIEQKAERLEREKTRLETVVHRRMVAEGVARQWCETFDPMLDATGLAPRKKKAIIRGTMVFEMERDEPLTEEVMESMKEPGTWTSYINSSKIRVAEIECEVPEATVALS